MTKEQKILLAMVLVIAGVSATFYIYEKKEHEVTDTITETQTTQQVTQQERQPVPPQNTTQSASKTIKETMAYTVPNGKSETINVTFVVNAQGIIEDVVFSYETPSNPISQEKLGSFSKALSDNKTVVVGKKIADISLARLGGASLTTEAFNKVVASVRAKM